MQTYLPLHRIPRHSSAEANPLLMASSNVSTVYISVIDDVISKVREDFITYGVGDAVLNELQAVRTSDLSIPSFRPLQFFLISAILTVVSPIRPRKP